MRRLNIINIFSFVDFDSKVNVVGWLALSAYILTWLPFFDFARTAEIIFLICVATALFSKYRFDAKNHFNLILIFVLFVILQVCVQLYAVERFPELVGEQMKTSRHYTKLFLCVLVGLWVRGNVMAAKYLVSLMVIGFLISLLFNSTVAEWVSGVRGSRVDFGYMNAQHTSMYFGWLLLFSVCMIIYSFRDKWRLTFKVICIMLLLLSLTGVIITQTRAVWLSLIVVAFVLVLIFIFNAARISIKLVSKKITLLLAAVFFIGFVVVSSDATSILKKRSLQESDVILVAAKGGLDDVPLTSIGIRLHTWAYAIEKIKERPLTGWGSKSRKSLIKEGDFPKWIKDRFGHFHNSYLEILLSYGVLGFLIFLLLVVYIFKGIFSLISKDLVFGYGLLSAWLNFLVVNIFESYLIFSSGMFFFIAVGGVSISFYIYSLSDKRKALNE